jgi:hypothetical protein
MCQQTEETGEPRGRALDFVTGARRRIVLMRRSACIWLAGILGLGLSLVASQGPSLPAIPEVNPAIFPAEVRHQLQQAYDAVAVNACDLAINGKLSMVPESE